MAHSLIRKSGSQTDDAIRNFIMAASSNTPVLPWLPRGTVRRTNLSGLPSL